MFLCTTGAEALYSDLGHCGRGNIRVSWTYVKLALILNYFGQGAHLLTMRGQKLNGVDPFYSLMPQWFLITGIIIATIAAIRDSRASGETIDDGRSAEVERWIWSPTEGLVRIKRVPAQRKDGKGYTKKNIDTPIQKPIKNPDNTF